MTKKIKVEIEVEDETTESIIKEAMKEFCNYHFKRGNEAKIDVEEKKDE